MFVCGKSGWPVVAVVIVALCCLDARPLLAAETWKTVYYNPAPAEGDVMLPMPCGGSMTFRRVTVPAEGEGPLSDLRVDLGANDARLGYAENTLSRYVAGSFRTGNEQPYLLMGKYEVSKLQYQAVMAAQCPEPGMALRLPQAEMTWYDAVSFAWRWTRWLLENAADHLPRVNGSPGFVRLPTEVEWEYAARGGAAVSFADFRERVFPMPRGMPEYVWFAGSKSANGKAQLTGLLAANPLGLHDMLGNLDEITLEPFRLNHLDRLHGQIGGFVVRGGNFFTDAADIRVSYRKEVPHFQEKGELRARTTGFRVVLGAPVIGSVKQLDAIRSAWQGLGKSQPAATAVAASDSKPSPASLGAIQGDPADEVDVLTEAVADARIKERLQRLGRLMRAAQEEQLQQRTRAAKASLRMGGVICQQIGKDGLFLDALRQRNRKFCSGDPGKPSLFSAKECEERQAAQTTEEGKFANNLDRYAQAVMEVARSYQPAELGKFGDALLGELEDNDSSRGLREPVSIYRGQTIAYANSWLVKRSEWSEQCKAAFSSR